MNYYDDFESIQKQFLASWDTVEKHFQDSVNSNNGYSQAILRIVQEMRSLEYDHYVRLENEWFQLIFARTREPKISFAHMRWMVRTPDSMNVLASLNKKIYVLEEQPLKLSTEIRALLELLMVQPME
jgi:hypothetical protein